MAQVMARELAGSGCICSKRIRKSTRCGDFERCKFSSLARVSGRSKGSRMLEIEDAAVQGVSATRARVEDKVARYDSLQ